MKHTMWQLVLIIITLAVASAQVCEPTEVHPQPDSAFAYMRAEIKALQWIRLGLTESRKIPPLAPPSDPQRMDEALVRNTIGNRVADDYNCAANLVKPYKDSKNEFVRASVEALLTGIERSMEINRLALEEMQSIDKATKAEEVDQSALGRLVELTKREDKARNIVMGGVKISTFSVVRVERGGDNAEPVAFTITAKQRKTLLTDAQELAKKKDSQDSLVDVCAEILLSTLTKQVPTTSP